MTLAGRQIVLGVSGGIACYKACTLARRLTEAGALVDCVLTQAAGQFVRPLTFEALTGRPVLSSLWEPGRALDHIGLAQEPDAIVIAPATANLLARAAQGLADDLLTAILLARSVPVLAAPAMNDRMYQHEATQLNLDTLRKRGWAIIGPEVGPLAEGPSDLPGRMSEPEDIIAELERLLLSPETPWLGRKVLITAGPTREAIDAVRLLSNRSSGKMGLELARVARAYGADVTLVTGPTDLDPPYGVKTVRVDSTEEMCVAVRENLAGMDALIMAAAPADFLPVESHEGKLRRSEGLTLELRPTADILVETAPNRPDGCVVIGFALEYGDGVDRAREKLAGKDLDLVVLNRADQDDSGFEVDSFRATLVSPAGEDQLPLMSKSEAAARILERAGQLL